MAKTLAVFVDALSDDYITEEDTPNLWRWKQAGGYAALDPLFAFKGVGTSMFTGFPPSDTGIWADFKLRRPPAIQARADPVLSVLERLPDGLARKGAVLVYEKLLRGAHVTPHRVPPAIRPLLEPAVRRGLGDAVDVGGRPTVSKLLAAEGRTPRAIGLDGGPQGLYMRLLPRLHRLPGDLIVLKISSLDGLGHAHGPTSEVLKRILRRIDALLGRLEAARDGAQMVVFSDHGMTPVRGSVDVMALVHDELSDMELGVDFVPFYSSTCAVFRWRDEDTGERARKALADHEHIRFLDEDDEKRLDIQGVRPDYGDDILVTEPGWVIAPDFYRDNAPAGMHGFATLDGERAVVVSPDQELRATGKMWDLAPTLLELAGSEAGRGMDGTSLLDRAGSTEGGQG